MPSLAADPESTELRHITLADWYVTQSAQLRMRAAAMLRKRSGIITLRPSDVVSEAIMKMFDFETETNRFGKLDWMCAYSMAVKDVVIDHDRRRRAAKRGGGQRATSMVADPPAEQPAIHDMVALNEAIERLRRDFARQAKVVVMKYFGGFTTKEIADALRTSVSTVEADWRQARGRLFAILNPPDVL